MREQIEQRATRIAFFMAGLAVAAWAPLVPFAKARAQLDEGGLGLILLCLGAGSLLSMPPAGVWAARSGCRVVLRVTSLVACVTLPLLAIIDSPVGLGLTLFVFGGAIGAMDCTMNVMAVEVEKQAGKPMMSGIHAFYSIGGLVGAAGMSALLSVGLKPTIAALAIAAALFVLLIVAGPHWLAQRAARDGPPYAIPHGVVWLIGLSCVIAFLAEGAMLDWSAVLLSDIKQMPAAQAGAGFVAFSVTMTLMRLFGDALIRRWGLHRNIAIGAMSACAGLLITALAPIWPLTLLGCAITGASCANIVPALFSLAGRQQAMPASLAIPAVTTMGYAGILAGPALIGLAAQASSLTVAIAGVGLAMLVVALFVRTLPS